MIHYGKSFMYQHETECYGCTNKTTNISGMCDDCGGERGIKDTLERPERTAHTHRQALSMIEKGG